jgi:energy-coupling factor transporter transmembrane protein EcfT
MKARLSPLFRYNPVVTPVHRIPALAKLCALVAVSIGVFCAQLMYPLIAGGALVTLAILAKIPLSSHLKNVRILLWYALFIIVFRFAGPLPPIDAIEKGLAESGLYLFRLALILLAGTVFYETTSTLEIMNALYILQNVIARMTQRFRTKGSKKTVRVPDIALLLSLTITFIPRIFDSWIRLNHSWDARGGNLHRGFRASIHRITTLVPLLIISLLAVACDTDRAIRNRSRTA